MLVCYLSKVTYLNIVNRVYNSKVNCTSVSSNNTNSFILSILENCLRNLDICRVCHRRSYRRQSRSEAQGRFMRPVKRRLCGNGTHLIAKCVAINQPECDWYIESALRCTLCRCCLSCPSISIVHMQSAADYDVDDTDIRNCTLIHVVMMN